MNCTCTWRILLQQCTWRMWPWPASQLSWPPALLAPIKAPVAVPFLTAYYYVQTGRPCNNHLAFKLVDYGLNSHHVYGGHCHKRVRKHPCFSYRLGVEECAFSTRCEANIAPKGPSQQVVLIRAYQVSYGVLFLSRGPNVLHKCRRTAAHSHMQPQTDQLPSGWLGAQLASARHRHLSCTQLLGL